MIQNFSRITAANKQRTFIFFLLFIDNSARALKSREKIFVKIDNFLHNAECIFTVNSSIFLQIFELKSNKLFCDF
jgi:hypothetical protein